MREPTEKEIHLAKEIIREDAAEDFQGRILDFTHYLTEFERKAFTAAIKRKDFTEIGRLFDTSFYRGVNRNIDIEAKDMAQGWQELGERA